MGACASTRSAWGACSAGQRMGAHVATHSAWGAGQHMDARAASRSAWNACGAGGLCIRCDGRQREQEHGLAYSMT
jgi:hypothetical protein